MYFCDCFALFSSLPKQKVLPFPTNPYLQLQTFPEPSAFSSHVALAWQVAHTSRGWPPARTPEEVTKTASHPDVKIYGRRRKCWSDPRWNTGEEAPPRSRFSSSSLSSCRLHQLFIPIFGLSGLISVPWTMLEAERTLITRMWSVCELRSPEQIVHFLNGRLAAGGFVASSCHPLTHSVTLHRYWWYV